MKEASQLWLSHKKPLSYSASPVTPVGAIRAQLETTIKEHRSYPQTHESLGCQGAPEYKFDRQLYYCSSDNRCSSFVIAFSDKLIIVIKSTWKFAQTNRSTTAAVVLGTLAP